MIENVKILQLGRKEYTEVWKQLKEFTLQREADTVDQIWLLEHEAVYTQGQAGKPEHIFDSGTIPIVNSDRGGQVTYHGPGQLIVYFLTDILRKSLNIRSFVSCLEQSVIKLLATYNIAANNNLKAPGVYVNEAKICSVGLRVRHGRTYHGLSLNVAMDLEPFTRINPCGYTGMQVVQLCDLGGPTSVAITAQQLLPILIQEIGYKGIIHE
jgi:lipoyl(octanoyl) transferase